MNHMPPLTRLQLLAIVTVAVSVLLALLGYSGGLWAVVTESTLICLVGASILGKSKKSR